MLSLIVAAAESSKVPFYVAGAVLALWAVALAWFGLTRPTFPSDERSSRGVMAISFVLVVIAIAMAVTS